MSESPASGMASLAVLNSANTECDITDDITDDYAAECFNGIIYMLKLRQKILKRWKIIWMHTVI